jgi:tRNA-2-methylthio-N6-dimethylallyladenosine synthase
MNRKHTREFYIDLIKKIRVKKPDIAIGTDIIVGFPGETEKDFQDTVDLYKQCDFDIAYLAQYSSRSGTAAAKAFKDNVPHAKKERRWFILQHLMEEVVLHKNQKYVGQTVSVLVDSYKNGECIGNSSEMKVVSFSGNADLIGKIVGVRIYEAKEWILYGIKL